MPRAPGIARFENVVIGGDVQQMRLGGVERNFHDGFTAAAAREQQEQAEPRE